jgi:hypothetical protein
VGDIVGYANPNAERSRGRFFNPHRIKGRRNHVLMAIALDHEVQSVADLGRVSGFAGQQRERLHELRDVMATVAGEEECGQIDTLIADIDAGIATRSEQQTTALLLELLGDAA